MTTIKMKCLELKEAMKIKFEVPQVQRNFCLAVALITLLLNNSLYNAMALIIPDYLSYLGVYSPSWLEQAVPPDYAMNLLLASKLIVQLLATPFAGALIDRRGYDKPMTIGLVVMLLSTTMFAFSRSFENFVFARCLQGLGAAFTDTAALATIADKFREKHERAFTLGIALIITYFGQLVTPNLIFNFYQFAGMGMPFLILGLNYVLLLVVNFLKEPSKEPSQSVPIWTLFKDPYIAVCAGALMMSNVALAFLQATVDLWMVDRFSIIRANGLSWFLSWLVIFPQLVGIILVIMIAKRYPQHQWLMAIGGLALEGICCSIIPFSTTAASVIMALSALCLGAAIVAIAILPIFGYLVDIRHASVYGSIYAIAGISQYFVYVVGPLITRSLIEVIDFEVILMIISVFNLLYVPALMYLKNVII